MISLHTSFGRRVFIAAILFLIPLIYFYPAVTGKVILLPGDGWTANLGLRVLVGQMLSQGQLPLWNPYIFAGMPLLASIYPAALYPPNWIYVFLAPKAASNVVVITTYHLALIGSYLYARSVGIDRLGGVITGIAFTFSGYLIVHLGQTSHIASAVWLPWILLAVEKIYQTLSWRWISLGAAFIALQLFAGVPQMTLYTVLTGSVYWLFTLIRRCDRPRRARFVGGTLVMAVCGGLLSAVQLLPLREMQQQGDRSGVTYEVFSQYSLPPWQLLEIVFPFFFGGDTTPPFRINFWGAWGFGETCGYVGALTLILAMIALIGAKPSPVVWLWGWIAIMALFLSMGSYLPFEINRFLFKIPIYNIFRAPARHLYEFSFAVAVLAGFGTSYLVSSERSLSRKTLLKASFFSSGLFVFAAILYMFSGQWFPSDATRPASAGNITNLEALVPLFFFIISLTLAGAYRTNPRSAVGWGLAGVLFIDLMAFGHVLNWKSMTFDAAKRITEPDVVKEIKSRETNFHEFRVLSHAIQPYHYWPETRKYEDLNWPNISILHGLQSANGYDMLRLQRLSSISGEMTPAGEIADMTTFDNKHRGFDLLNIRYHIRERRKALLPSEEISVAETKFSRNQLAAELSSGAIRSFICEGQNVDKLVLVTFMGNSVHINNNFSVAQVTIRSRNGQVTTYEIQAGRDTAEWAYDRGDVRKTIKHQRPVIAESWEAEGFQGHTYLTTITFPRTEIDIVTFESLLPADSQAAVLIKYASLIDSEKKDFYPIDTMSLSAERWRRLQRFGEIDLYENLTARPRAWFVSRLKVLQSKEVLKAVKEGYLVDGVKFDPVTTGLLEVEDYGGHEMKIPPTGDTNDARVNITRYEPNRINLKISNPQPGFLVLSEIWYRGWECWIDGSRVPVQRVNYALRGIATPPGEHRVEFIFRAHSFRNGAAYTLLGGGLLIAGAIITRRFKNKDAPQ